MGASWGEACRGEATSLSPCRCLLCNRSLETPQVVSTSFSFRGLFNISNKNKINNCSVYGNLRQKRRRLRRKLSGSRPEGGFEDSPFLGVRVFLLQLVSSSTTPMHLCPRYPLADMHKHTRVHMHACSLTHTHTHALQAPSHTPFFLDVLPLAFSFIFLIVF